jgi:hypothetical protein
MVEIWPGLHVGNELDYENNVQHQEGWSVVHACKEPYHREALGYRTRRVPDAHPESLVARRGERLMLNLVDMTDPAYIPKEAIDAALDFIHEALGAGRRVLLHCNLGSSRSPTIALLYLLSRTHRFPTQTFDEAEVEFRVLYPSYAPALGMHEFARLHFEHYRALTACG